MAEQPNNVETGLEFVETEALCEELKRRCDAMVVLMMPKVGSNAWVFRGSGNLAQCCGLLEQGRMVVRQQMARAAREGEGS